MRMRLLERTTYSYSETWLSWQAKATWVCKEVFRDGAGQDDAHDLEYRDGYLYVTGQTSHSFGVVQIIDPKIRMLADKPQK